MIPISNGDSMSEVLRRCAERVDDLTAFSAAELRHDADQLLTLVSDDKSDALFARIHITLMRLADLVE